MAHYRSPYETLNVSPDAELIVIEAAHRALIRKYHPDLWLDDPNAQSRAAAINEAYATLKDPASRSLCDQRLRAMRNAAQAASLQQLRGRSRGARWWTGWLAALVIAGSQLVPWEDIRLPAAQLASQSAPARVTAAAVAEVEAEAEAKVAQQQAKGSAVAEKPLPAGLVALLEKGRERESAFLATLEKRDVAAEPAATGAQQARPAHRPNDRKRSRRQPSAPAEPTSSPDFLEREGYIY